jgi:hypothetical protein
MGMNRNIHKIVVGTPETKRPVRKPCLRSEGNRADGHELDSFSLE